jgi:type III pantothenate kinase
VILCIDAGNTRVKWGVSNTEASGWLAQGALDYADLDQLPARLPAVLPAVPTVSQRIVACNVAGTGIGERIERMVANMGSPLHWLKSSAAACGVTNGYAQPTQLGADRWAALIGARALGFAPAVVVMAGTATTIDLLDADGHFRGGLILPGLDLMRASLARDTANLPRVSASADGYSLAPTTTDAAIVSGSIHATLGAIDRMREGLRGGLGASLSDKARVVLSGGAANVLRPHLAPSPQAVENLVLEGLREFALTIEPTA